MAIPYWIEHDENGNPINYVWVKIPKIPAQETITYIIEKTDGYTPNGDAVFDFFDDFDESLDVSKWVVKSGVSYYITNSELHVTDRDTHIASQVSFSNPRIFGARIRVLAVNGQLGFELGDNQNHDSKRIYFLPTGAEDIYIDPNGSGYVVVEDIFTDAVGDVYSPFEIKTTVSATVFSFKRNGISWFKNYDYGWADNNYIGLGGYQVGVTSKTSNEVAFNFVYVRKYTTNEPTVVIEDRGTYYKLEITNNETIDLFDYQVAIPVVELNIQSATESLKIVTPPKSYIAYITCKEECNL